jgi:hypothetical protein
MTKQKQHPAADDPVLIAASEAIGNMIALLTEAQNYLQQGERLCVIGTMIMFEDHAEDVRAAVRIIRMQRRPS